MSDRGWRVGDIAISREGIRYRLTDFNPSYPRMAYGVRMDTDQRNPTILALQFLTRQKPPATDESK